MQCNKCRFWNDADLSLQGLSPDEFPGHCQRYPPVLNPIILKCEMDEDALCEAENGQRFTQIEATEAAFRWTDRWSPWCFPLTTASDWCGEYQPKEE